MYARILLALALGLLIFAGEQRLLFAQGAITIGPGIQQAPQQQQQQHPCQAEFEGIRSELQNRGKSLQDAGKRKATAKELCSRINGYAASESKMLRFLTGKAQECGIPPEAAAGLQKSQVKTAELRTKICNAANNPQQQQTPSSPSTGLSGAINQNTGVVPETPLGGGIFDTLSGNVLQQ
jgi:Skp family chaperone for outer membrane proteins